MIKRQWYWNLREIRVLFYEWVERCETGKAWDLLCKKKKIEKKCSLKSTLCCLTPLFLIVWFFNFYFFLPSQTWTLGFSLDRLQKILCLVFRLLVAFLLFFSLPPLCEFIFSQKISGFFFFPKKISRFGICLLGFLRTFWPSLFCYCCSFPLFIFEAFCSKFSFIKGEPAQFRFHSSEFSVSIMHSSLLS